MITLTETVRPSRSKAAGPCWTAIVTDGGREYANAAGVTIQIEAGETIEVASKATLRRSTRTTTDRRAWTLRVTGDPADVTELVTIAGYVEATVTGAVLA